MLARLGSRCASDGTVRRKLGGTPTAQRPRNCALSALCLFGFRLLIVAFGVSETSGGKAHASLASWRLA
jgi:hypothetical protein